MLISLHVVLIVLLVLFCVFFFFKQKTAYEMRISDWSSGVCSSDLTFSRPWSSSMAGTKCHCTSGVGASGVTFQKPPLSAKHVEIGRASCRERVCQYV